MRLRPFAALVFLSFPLAAATDYVPLTFRQVSGTRPFVSVKLNSVPFLFMVHANARFYAMTTHANAAMAGIGPLRAERKYGITAPGQVSELGRASTVAHSLQVGDDVVTNAPLQVFEVPQTPVMNGMLGIGWLRGRRAMVDYVNGRIALPGSDEDAKHEHGRLRSEGYTAHRMSWDETRGAFTVEVEVNGRHAPFIVSTVSSLVVDAGFAAKAGIAVGGKTDDYAGPAGATGEVRASRERVTLRIDGQALTPVPAEVYDIYAYSSTSRPSTEENLTGGYLGCDVMLSSRAVIDFGSGLLFLRLPEPR